MEMEALRQQAAKLSSKVKPAAGDAGDTERGMGDDAMECGEYTEAVDWYSKALEKSPENEALWVARSSALLKMHCCREALLDARTAVQLAPTWHDGYYHLGRAFQELGMLGYAETAFKNAKRMCPAFEDADEGLQELRKTISDRHALQRKQSGGPLSLCQRVYTGDYEAVKEYLTSGKALSPEFVTLPHRELFMTPMQVALLNQFFDIAQLLLDNDILFPENVCDWMIAQTVAERRARQEAETDLRSARQDSVALQGDLLAARQAAEALQAEHDAHTAELRRMQDQLDALASRLTAAQREAESASVASGQLERRLREAEEEGRRLQATVRSMEAALVRSTEERDALAREVDGLKLKAGVEVEGRLQSLSWRIQENPESGDVELSEVSPLVDPEAVTSDTTRCLRHCFRTHETFQHALYQVMKAREVETAARSAVREALSQTDQQAAWPLPVAVTLEAWYTLQVDLDREDLRAAKASVKDMKAVLSHIKKLQTGGEWEPLLGLLDDLHGRAEQILELLVTGRIDDTGYAAVLQGVVDDLQRSVREEPVGSFLLNLPDKESAVKKALQQVKDWLKKPQDLEPKVEESQKALKLVDALLDLITRKINILSAEPSTELTKVRTLAQRSAEIIAKLRRTWSEVADLVAGDILALRKCLEDHKAETEVHEEAREHQRVFNAAVLESDQQQEDLWAAVTHRLAQLGKLQEDRTAMVKRRLADIWAMKRKQKVHQAMLDLVADRLGRLATLERRCSRAQEGTSLLSQFVSTYSSQMGKYLQDTRHALKDEAVPLHQSFVEWVTRWVEDQLALLQLKRQRLAQLPQGADPRPLEREIAEGEALLRARVAQLDGPGQPGAFLAERGVHFSHPRLLIAPPTRPEPAAINPPGVMTVPTYTFQLPDTTVPMPSYMFQQQYGPFPGMPSAANPTEAGAMYQKPIRVESYSTMSYPLPPYTPVVPASPTQYYSGPSPYPISTPHQTTYQFYQSPGTSQVLGSPGPIPFVWH